MKMKHQVQITPGVTVSEIRIALNTLPGGAVFTGFAGDWLIFTMEPPNPEPPKDVPVKRWTDDKAWDPS